MTRTEIAKLWGTLSVLTAGYAGGSWIASQTAGASSPLPVLLDHRPVQGSLIALVAVPFIATLSNVLLWHHARLAQSGPWTRRIPQFWIRTSARPNFLDRAYSGCVLVILTILPLASLVHFARKVMEYGVIGDLKTRSAVELFGWLPPDVWLDDSRFRMGHGLEDALDHGVTFYPVIEPVLIAFLMTGAFVSAAVALRAVFSASGRRSGSPAKIWA